MDKDSHYGSQKAKRAPWSQFRHYTPWLRQSRIGHCVTGLWVLEETARAPSGAFVLLLAFSHELYLTRNWFVFIFLVRNDFPSKAVIIELLMCGDKQWMTAGLTLPSATCRSYTCHPCKHCQMFFHCVRTLHEQSTPSFMLHLSCWIFTESLTKHGASGDSKNIVRSTQTALSNSHGHSLPEWQNNCIAYLTVAYCWKTILCEISSSVVD